MWSREAQNFDVKLFVHFEIKFHHLCPKRTLNLNLALNLIFLFLFFFFILAEYNQININLEGLNRTDLALEPWGFTQTQERLAP